MTAEKIQMTSLWKRTLDETIVDNYSFQRSRLRSEFLAFREKVEMLVRKIGSVLPGLTVHDISHLDGLWETADLIAGNDYPLNPLEAFFLRGSCIAA